MNESNFPIDCQNLAYVERLLEQFQRDPSSVSPTWQEYFRDNADSDGHGATKLQSSLSRFSLFNPPVPSNRDAVLGAERLQDRVDQLIRNYRVRGHLVAKLDPLGFARPDRPDLSIEALGLRASDLTHQFSTSSIGGPKTQTLEEIFDRLRNTYCRYIGVQFMHIDEAEVRDWLSHRMEASQNRMALSRDEQLRILTRLTDAVIFEQFVRKKYVGAKSFSLEGAESLIPLLDLAIERASQHGVKEIVVGMAHRGRLNVLANIIGKQPQEIFWEFDDPRPELHKGRGDVKYHMGFSGDWTTAEGRNVHMSLCFNPSHLEYVNPVVIGRMRAKLDRAGDTEHRGGMALLIHGDAAFAGEGVVQESLNMSGLPGYTVGGALHVIVNNQIGFTTGPEQSRSTTYATDVARMLQIPIFHVNGEQPEAVAQVITMALDFREQFQRDVVVDMYCYRRWGHNEADEPGFTQPVLYNAIEKHASVRESYLDHLLDMGGVTREEADRIAEQRYEHLENEFKIAKHGDFVPRRQTLTGFWQGYQGGAEPENDTETAVSADRLRHLLLKLTETPDDFNLHRKLQRYMQQRQLMAKGEQPLDWAAGEGLAIATLAVEGHRVRLTGQDVGRGTFSHRHAVLHDSTDGHRFEIFQHLTGPLRNGAGGLSEPFTEQAPVDIINSSLCESGDMGFQYGYSLDYPEALVAWEAQFGDFCNVAQVIIDQFIASAEDKWQRLSGLALLLPHGFEGQGPEHSSARLERWLMLAAENNMQIVSPSTPAQIFHLLRRQVKGSWRKPLVVFTPKSLLRHPQAVSSLDELSSAGFQRVISDQRNEAKETSRVLLCSGKIYYELAAAREEQQRDDVAIVRVEQLYPLPEKQLRQALQDYPDDLPVYWVQEEPENNGAWFYWKRLYCERLLDRFSFGGITRAESASPATGSSGAHKREQHELIEQALG